MDTVGKVERLAKISRILGILSVGIPIVAGLILIFVRFFLDTSDWVSGVGYVVLALLLFLVGLMLGLSACITALIVFKRNRAGGNERAIRRMANLGLVFGLVSVTAVLIFYISAWFLSSNASPPDIGTPIPSTMAP